MSSNGYCLAGAQSRGEIPADMANSQWVSKIFRLIIWLWVPSTPGTTLTLLFQLLLLGYYPPQFTIVNHCKP